MGGKREPHTAGIKGSRQIGKTTAVEMFSKEFYQYIVLNLEKEEDRKIFETSYPFQDLLMALFFYAGKERHAGRTLIFIDEIQNAPKATIEKRKRLKI